MVVETHDRNSLSEVVGASDRRTFKERKWMHIYNGSQKSQRVRMHDGQYLLPGETYKVPYRFGLALVQKVPYIHTAERGDVLGTIL